MYSQLFFTSTKLWVPKILFYFLPVLSVSCKLIVMHDEGYIILLSFFFFLFLRGTFLSILKRGLKIIAFHQLKL